MSLKLRPALHSKLFFSYVILILAAVFGITALLSVRSGEILNTQAKNWTMTSLDQAQSLLSAKINHLSYVLDLAVSNTAVQRILERDKRRYSFRDQISDVQYFEQMASNIKNNNPIADVKFYVSNVRYKNQNSSFYNLDTLKQTSIYNRLSLSKDKIYWSDQNPLIEASSPDVLSAYMCIRNPGNHQMVDAVIRLDFLKKDIMDILSQAIQNTGGSILLLNSEIDQLASVEENENLNFDSAGRDFWNKMRQYGYRWQGVSLNDETVYTSIRAINNTDWFLVALIPNEAVIRESNALQHMIGLLCLVIVAISIPVATLISRLIVRRLEHLSYAMHQVQQGNWQVKVHVGGHDEISRIKDDFDYMLLKIRMLTDEKVDAVSKLKDAELLALQSQINPHFLYNSLDSINWMAFAHKAPDIQTLVQDLAKFYRIALSEGNIIIPLNREIDHVRMYINVQNIRYEQKIIFHTEGVEGFPDASIPKITLQPIVENAILHGIMKRPEKSGHITITVEQLSGTLRIHVRDDGVGIPIEKRGNLLGDSSSTGYGLRNVDLRLKKYYGASYGLSFESSSKGTTVTISIPFRGDV